MSDSLATLNTEGDVSVITLNDGKVNVFSLEMIDQLNSLLDQVPEDKGSLLIKGKEGIFSPGIPIGETKIDNGVVKVLLFSDLSQVSFVNVKLNELNLDSEK